MVTLFDGHPVRADPAALSRAEPAVTGNVHFTGGRHGYGAKLTNIFSHAFEVDTADSTRGLRYRQVLRAVLGGLALLPSR